MRPTVAESSITESSGRAIEITSTREARLPKSELHRFLTAKGVTGYQ